jgi:hypothetical protein
MTMEIVWGVVMIALASLAWGGQTLAWLAPAPATRWGLTEAEEEVEPVFHADIRGEARLDAFTLWTLLAAGVLLVLDHAAWPHFGLVGGGIYAYFAGRGISTRLEMQHDGFRIGSPRSLRVAYAFLVAWGVLAVVTIAAAVAALR